MSKVTLLEPADLAKITEYLETTFSLEELQALVFDTLKDTPNQILPQAKAASIANDTTPSDKPTSTTTISAYVSGLLRPLAKVDIATVTDSVIAQVIDLLQAALDQAPDLEVEFLLRNLVDSKNAAEYYDLALIYANEGDKDRAFECFDNVLNILKDLGEKGWEAATLNSMGLTYDAFGYRERALVHYNQALVLSREVGERDGEAATLTNMGVSYSELGYDERGLECYLEALTLYRAIGSKKGEAGNLNNLGSAYSNLGYVELSIEYYEKALSLYLDLGERGNAVATSYNLAWVYYAVIDALTKAVAYMEQCVELARQVQYPDLAEKEGILRKWRQELELADGQGS
jgi:tetratricopeptide (TPR) repeat protein